MSNDELLRTWLGPDHSIWSDRAELEIAQALLATYPAYASLLAEYSRTPGFRWALLTAEIEAQGIESIVIGIQSVQVGGLSCADILAMRLKGYTVQLLNYAPGPDKKGSGVPLQREHVSMQRALGQHIGREVARIAGDRRGEEVAISSQCWNADGEEWFIPMADMACSYDDLWACGMLSKGPYGEPFAVWSGNSAHLYWPPRPRAELERFKGWLVYKGAAGEPIDLFWVGRCITRGDFTLRLSGVRKPAPVLITARAT